MGVAFYAAQPYAFVGEHADVHPSAHVGNPAESRSHPSVYPAVIQDTARVGPGATVDQGTVRDTVVAGWVFAHAHVGHDCIVEEDAEVSTGAVLGGHSHVKRGARVGINATVLPFKTVGENAVVGAGAVVTKDVPAGEVWAGNPARFMRRTDETAADEWADWFERTRA